MERVAIGVTTTVNEVDNTVKDKKLADKKAETYIIPVIIMTILVIISFIKYSQYKAV